jgi:hypothetical protein
MKENFKTENFPEIKKSLKMEKKFHGVRKNSTKNLYEK